MKVLIIGPYAPHGQVGAQRIISLSKYLINKKHDVSVLCLSRKTLEKMDKLGLTAPIPKGVKSISYDITINCSSVMKKNYINGKQCKNALKTALKKEKYDIIFLSAGPFYTFNAIGVAKKYKIPYVVDYRDLHLSSPDKRKRSGFTNKFKFAISFPVRFLQEYICLKNAHMVTVVSPEMKQNLCEYFKVKQEKINVIYNGYDDVALKNISKKKENNKIFYIGYFGKLMYYKPEFTIMLFKAINKLNEQKYNIKLLHIGPKSENLDNYFDSNNIDASTCYEYVGQKEYKEGIEMLSGCNAFYLEYTMPEGPGTKVFDYIFLNKPIIAIVRQGISLEKLLKSYDNSFVCCNESQIENAILKIINDKIHCLTTRDGNIISKYSRSFQNEKLEELLKAICGDD